MESGFGPHFFKLKQTRRTWGSRHQGSLGKITFASFITAICACRAPPRHRVHTVCVTPNIGRVRTGTFTSSSFMTISRLPYGRCCFLFTELGSGDLGELAHLRVNRLESTRPSSVTIGKRRRCMITSVDCLVRIIRFGVLVRTHWRGSLEIMRSDD